MFFGNWGVDFLFHMYFLIRYCRSLEEGSFRGQPADFTYFLLLGMVSLLVRRRRGLGSCWLYARVLFVALWLFGVADAAA